MPQAAHGGHLAAGAFRYLQIAMGLMDGLLRGRGCWQAASATQLAVDMRLLSGTHMWPSVQQLDGYLIPRDSVPHEVADAKGALAQVSDLYARQQVTCLSRRAAAGQKGVLLSLTCWY